MRRLPGFRDWPQKRRETKKMITRSSGRKPSDIEKGYNADLSMP
jgi:hypothetical protein